MKVLHICPDYFNVSLYKIMFESLNSYGIRNSVFTAIPEVNEDFKNDMHNVTVFVKYFSILNRLIYFFKQQQIYRAIISKFSVRDYNIVHAHTLFSAGYAAYKLWKNFDIPYIVAIRNTDVNTFLKYMIHLRGLGRSIIINAQAVIFISPSYRNKVLNKYFKKNLISTVLKKSIVIPNGIDDFFLRNKFINARSVNPGCIKIIFTGYVTSNKNIETTIKACNILISKGYDVIFTIVGIIEAAKYKKTIANTSFIRYFPWCSKEEILLHLRSSDIFVMPSITETFGLSYAEAMSQGLPVIYSKDEGFDGQFENGMVGYSVNSFDYIDISNKIIVLHNNYQEFSKRCVSLVDKFRWENIGMAYKSLYMNNITDRHI